MVASVARVRWRALAAALALILLFVGCDKASAQAWWDSLQNGAPEVQKGFLPTPSIATSLPHNGDPGGYPQMARRARHRLRPGIHQRRALQRPRRHEDRHHRPGQAAGHRDHRSRQARRLGGASVFRQRLPDPQHRPVPPRLRRRHQHHRRHRGAVDDAAVGDLARADLCRRQWPASRSARSPPTANSSSATSARCSCKAIGRPSLR